MRNYLWAGVIKGGQAPEGQLVCILGSSLPPLYMQAQYTVSVDRKTRHAITEGQTNESEHATTQNQAVMAKTALTFAHLRLVLVALQTTHAQRPKTCQLQVAMAQHCHA